MATLTNKGLEIKKIDQILAELQNIAKEKFSDLVAPDDELDVSSSSVLGRILGTVAEIDSYNEEALFQIWQSLDPDQAESIFLDKILNLVSIYRRSLSRGFVGLILHGSIGKTIYAGALASSKTTGVVFETTTDVTFSERNANGVTINILDVSRETSYSLGYTSMYSLNQYPTLSTTAFEGDTKNSVATRLKEIINNSSTQLEAYVDLSDNVVVKFKNANTIGDFSVSDSLQIIESFMPVSGVSREEEAERQASGTITLMQTSSSGWLGVTNPFDSIASKPEESDIELRERAGFSRALRSLGNRIALYAGLYEVSGVEYVNVKENVYETAQGQRSGKGISVVVFGGDEDDIAETIKRYIPIGCVTDGLIVKTLYDEAGSVDIGFSRPEVLPLEINLAITTDSSFPQNGRVLLQDALVQYIDGLEVGENIVWSKLFTPINSVKGVGVDSLTIGVKGKTLGTKNIELAYNQLPTISFNDIKI